MTVFFKNISFSPFLFLNSNEKRKKKSLSLSLSLHFFLSFEIAINFKTPLG